MEHSAHPAAAVQDVVAFPGKWLSGSEPPAGCSVGLRVLDSLDKISLQTTIFVVYIWRGRGLVNLVSFGTFCSYFELSTSCLMKLLCRIKCFTFPLNILP